MDSMRLLHVLREEAELAANDLRLLDQALVELLGDAVVGAEAVDELAVVCAGKATAVGSARDQERERSHWWRRRWRQGAGKTAWAVWRQCGGGRRWTKAIMAAKKSVQSAEVEERLAKRVRTRRWRNEGMGFWPRSRTGNGLATELQQLLIAEDQASGAHGRREGAVLRRTHRRGGQAT